MIGGELVREARKRAGLTQRELAERAGISQPAIARLESGRTSPSLEDVQRLIRLAGFELLVELALFDDSDRIQARARRHRSAEENVESNRRTIAQVREMREAVRAARA